MYPQGMAGGSKSGLTLPSFRKPPVVEVAMSIGFMPIGGLNFAAMADLRSRWMDSYPGAEEQPLLEPPATPQQSIKVEFGFGPQPRRLWLLSSQGDRVMQIQRDRLIANWRATPGSGEPYPRYQPLRDDFLRRWSDFEKFIVEHGVAHSVQPQYAEVTYVNVIRTDVGGHTDISAVLKMNKEGELWRDGVSTVAVNQSWELHDLQTFLTMAANVDSSAPESPIVLQISANTRINEGRDSASAVDLAHEFVVGTFGVVTTDEMQQCWERTE